MNLYSPPNSGVPQELPDRWRFADGTVRTDLKRLTNAELSLLNWIGPIVPPQATMYEYDENGNVSLNSDGNAIVLSQGDFDPLTHKAVWYKAKRKYVILDINIDDTLYSSGQLVYNQGFVPDWNKFKTTAVASTALNTFVGGLMTTAPVAALALPATLLVIENENYTDFENNWTAIENATTVPADLIAEMTALANECYLPEEFVNIFSA